MLTAKRLLFAVHVWLMGRQAATPYHDWKNYTLKAAGVGEKTSLG